jgi:hypothetical protein
MYHYYSEGGTIYFFMVKLKAVIFSVQDRKKSGKTFLRNHSKEYPYFWIMY